MSKAWKASGTELRSAFRTTQCPRWLRVLVYGCVYGWHSCAAQPAHCPAGALPCAVFPGFPPPAPHRPGPSAPGSGPSSGTTGRSRRSAQHGRLCRGCTGNPGGLERALLRLLLNNRQPLLSFFVLLAHFSLIPMASVIALFAALVLPQKLCFLPVSARD